MSVHLSSKDKAFWKMLKKKVPKEIENIALF